MFNTFSADRDHFAKKFSAPVFDPATGLDEAGLKARLEAVWAARGNRPHPVVKAELYACVADHVQIDVSPHDWYPGFGCWDRNRRPLMEYTGRWAAELEQAGLLFGESFRRFSEMGASRMWIDFDHSVPQWDDILELGFPGMLKRAELFRSLHKTRGTLTPETEAFFDGIRITLEASLRLIARLRDHARRTADGNPRVLAVAECLDRLLAGPPQTTYEALMFDWLVFFFGEHIDRTQVRSLGNLDRLLYPFFQRDVASGRYTEEQIREFVRYFLMQFAAIANYWGHPFYFGSTRADGSSEINPMSHLILDVFDDLGIMSPKLQIKVSPNTPRDFVDKALDMIRRGHSSIVFCNEPGMMRALIDGGATPDEARTCHISGCYEFGVYGKSNGTGPAHLNLPKLLELVFNDGADPRTGICHAAETRLSDVKSFEDFYAAYLTQVRFTVDRTIEAVNAFERYLHVINPTNVFSATCEYSLNSGRDAFSNGLKYNNTTILCIGIGTAVDALMAVREFVFDRPAVSLAGLKQALADNWAGAEKLRLRIRKSDHKHGNGDAGTDALLVRLANDLGRMINGRPNVRGGFFHASSHPARQFIELGKLTGATPDGRCAGDEFSKNMSPTPGMDRRGPTALIQSVTRVDSRVFPADFCLDLMLIPAAVSGEEGLAAMRGLLETYFSRHGLALNINVFDAAQLERAIEHPEEHEGLQVRVCGWNARFNDMVHPEKLAYVERAKNVSA